MMRSLRRIIVDIEMMPINDEITEQELMDYIKPGVESSKNVKDKRKRR